MPWTAPRVSPLALTTLMELLVEGSLADDELPDVDVTLALAELEFCDAACTMSSVKDPYITC